MLVRCLHALASILQVRFSFECQITFTALNAIFYSGVHISHGFVCSSRIEVAYQEAVALKRQEELIREEEAAGQAEHELKVKRAAADKEKRAKKKQVVFYIRLKSFFYFILSTYRLVASICFNVSFTKLALTNAS